MGNVRKCSAVFEDHNEEANKLNGGVQGIDSVWIKETTDQDFTLQAYRYLIDYLSYLYPTSQFS